MRIGSRLALLSMVVLSPLMAARARACGGGLVTTTAGTIGANTQRIILAVHGGVTDVVTEIGVPSTTADYGVLIPVAGQPTLDPAPVPSAELDALDQATAPKIFRTSSSSDDSGCGCPVAGGSNKSSATGSEPLGGSVQVSQPVTIGPVTAVVLTADTADALNAWLAQAGFVLPVGAQAIVASYAGPGQSFIAIRRAGAAATNAPTSVGVHFTVAGDQRALPLRFARIGAAEQIAFTAFVVADEVVGPAAPFTGLSLNELDRAVIRQSGYAAAISAAVEKNANHAFVLESFWNTTGPGANFGPVAPTLAPILAASPKLTRISTILPAAALDTDVAFTEPTTNVTNSLSVQREVDRHGAPTLAFASGFLMLGAVVRRRPRRPD